MTLVSLTALLAPARAERRGVGAMNVIQLELAEAIVAGAEAAGRGVVLQISENTVAYHGALRPIALASLAIAEASSADVCVHLDHAVSADLVQEAVALGIGSVMFDASRLEYDDNVSATADVVRSCHAAGVSVEAELGEVGGKDGVHAPGVRTRPDEAAAYVAATGVDALAVAVGSSHAMTTRDAELDDELIARLAEAVPVPLVLHGSSGVPDEALRAAVRAGIAKVNVGTALGQAMTAAIRRSLDADPALVDPRKFLAPARDAIAGAVRHILNVLG